MRIRFNFSQVFNPMAAVVVLIGFGAGSIGAVSGQAVGSFPVFVPVVISADTARTGVAVPWEADGGTPGAELFYQDLSLVGADWYYNYAGHSPTSQAMAVQGIGFVPMSWAGEDPKLDKNYGGYLLVFNEPEVSGQANLDQRQAVNLYLALKKKYSRATLVVGGVSAFMEHSGWYACKDRDGQPVLDGQGQPMRSWTSCFLNELDRRGLGGLAPAYWHAHAYVNEGTEAVGRLSLADAEETLQELHTKTGGTYWISEYADVTGNAASFCTFTRWMQDQTWIKRYAPFATRVEGSEPWYPRDFWGTPQRVSLIDYASPADAPKLTSAGQTYTQCGK